MASLFIAYRYVVFVLFVLCSVVTIGIGAWNLALSNTLLLPSSSAAVDTFLIFVGALGAVCLFPIMLIDILRMNVLTSQVRFETALMGLFWLLQTTGATATTITYMSSTVVCLADSPQASLEYCTSSTVLLSFSWIAAANSLIYFCTLMVLAIMRYSQDGQVWKASTMDYPWVGSRESLGSEAQEPVKEGKKSFALPAVPAAVRTARTSFAARMFAGKQVPDFEKHVQQPTSAAVPQPQPTLPLVQPSARQGSHGPRWPAPRTAPAQPRRPREHTHTPSTYSASSAGSSPYGLSDGSSSNIGLLSPASNPRHTHQRQRSLHTRRPPPLDLTLVTSFRAVRQPANLQ